LHPDRRPNDVQAEEEFKLLVDALLAATRSEAAGARDGEGDPPGDGSDRPTTVVGRAVPDVVADFTVGLGEAMRGGAQAARLRFSAPCRCRASRRSRRSACPACGGRGVRRIERRVTFRLPPGTRDGDLVRVAGVGADTDGAGRGELRVRIRVRLPAGIRLEGDDLHVELPLTIPEALFGVRIPLVSPRGPITVAVPAGCDGSRVLRVHGHGLPPRSGSNRPPGQLFLYPIVRLPSSPSAEQLRQLAALTTAYPDDLRAGLLDDQVPSRETT
jgi:molecular chaperone DnaJ